MRVVVTWRTSIRVTALVASALGALVAYAALLTSAPLGPREGFLGVGCLLGGLVLAGRAWLERIEAGPEGLVVRDVRGVRRIAWADVQEVEAIAEHERGRQRLRWKTTPEQASVLVLHTTKGAVRVARRQTDAFDAFVALLRADRAPEAAYREAPPVAVLDRSDPRVVPDLHGPASTRQAQLREGLHLGREVLFAIPLALLVTGAGAAAALLLAASGYAAPFGAAIPWVALAFGWRTLLRVRRERFGADYMRPARTPDELLATVNGLLAGAFLIPVGALVLYGTRGGERFAAAIFLLPGIGFATTSVREVRRMLREA